MYPLSRLQPQSAPLGKTGSTTFNTDETSCCSRLRFRDGNRAVHGRRCDWCSAGIHRMAQTAKRAETNSVQRVQGDELGDLRHLFRSGKNRIESHLARRREKLKLELLQTLRWPRPNTVRHVRRHGNRKQLAVRPDGKSGVGTEGRLAGSGKTTTDE
jgi:hypothetical protein